MQVHYEATQKSRGKHCVCVLGDSGGDGVFFSIFGGKPHTTDFYHFVRSIQEHQESPEYRTSPGDVSRLPQLKSHPDCGWHLLLVVQTKRVWQRDDHHLASLTFLLDPWVNLPGCACFFSPNYQNQFPSFHCSLESSGSPGPSRILVSDRDWQWGSRIAKRQDRVTSGLPNIRCLSFQVILLLSLMSNYLKFRENSD